MIRLLVLSVLWPSFFLPACAHAAGKPFRLAPEVPRAVLSIMPVLTVDERGSHWGHATPVGPRLLVTIGHVADSGRLRTVDGRPLSQLARGEGDTAVWYRNDGRPFDSWVQVSPKPPVIGQRLFWRVYLDGEHTQGVASGAFMGSDTEDDYMIDGTLHPGSSGSGVITAEGLLIGVMRATYQPFRIPPMTPTQELFGLLIARTYIRPLAVFTPVPVIPPLPGMDRP